MAICHVSLLMLFERRLCLFLYVVMPWSLMVLTLHFHVCVSVTSYEHCDDIRLIINVG